MARHLPHLRWAAGLRLLLVDDTAPPSLTEELAFAGIEAATFQRGTDALISFGRREPHAVVLAPLLPDVAAVEMVAALRGRGSLPILLGVGDGDVDAAGPVLMAGATAAVSRPYDAVEIVTWLARELPRVPAEAALEFGPLRLEPRAHAVYVGEDELEHLPLKEFELLRLLMTHADMVVRTDDIKRSLWAEAPEPSNNTLAVHVQRLRKRLPADLEVLMVRGMGYRLTWTAQGRRTCQDLPAGRGARPHPGEGNLTLIGPAR